MLATNKAKGTTMLLDNLRVDDKTELQSNASMFLDGSISGEISIGASEAIESQMAITMELANILIDEHNQNAATAWKAVLRILRLLPWNIDAETASPKTPDERIGALYRYFGGLEYTDLDKTFTECREMAKDKDWSEIIRTITQA